MARALQVLLIASTLLGSWLGMQLVHEAGHVLGAWWTGGRVEQVVLSPLTISRTDLAENPHPLAVVWAGPFVGVLVPLLGWGTAFVLRIRAAFLSQFFAGFCLLANGLYISIGSLQHIGDAGEMLCHGTPIWQLWLFGLLTAPAGLLLWNGLGPRFGLGSAQGRVDPAAAYGSLACCLALLAWGFFVGGE